MTRIFRSLALAATLALPVAAEAAPVPAIDLTSNWSVGGYDNTGFSAGYRFTVNSDINVVGLGSFDLGGDGIIGGAQVGLYDLAGSLLASVDIGQTAGDVIGSFRFLAIDAVKLLAGVDYVIASYSTDPKSSVNSNYPNVTFTEDSRISVVENRWAAIVSELTFPNREPLPQFRYDATFGPNMLIEDVAAPVPVPAALPLMLGGLALMGVVARRRKA